MSAPLVGYRSLLEDLPEGFFDLPGEPSMPKLPPQLANTGLEMSPEAQATEAAFHAVDLTDLELTSVDLTPAPPSSGPKLPSLPANPGLEVDQGAQAAEAAFSQRGELPAPSMESCGRCDFRSTCKEGLRGHKERHSAKLAFTCHMPGCGYSVGTGAALTVHVSQHHFFDPKKLQNARASQLPFSPMKMQVRSSPMKMQVRSLGEGDKPFKCPKCDFAATTGKALNKHFKRCS